MPPRTHIMSNFKNTKYFAPNKVKIAMSGIQGNITNYTNYKQFRGVRNKYCNWSKFDRNAKSVTKVT